MNLDVPQSPRQGQTQTQFVKRCAAGFVEVLRGVNSVHRSIQVPDTEPFMRELITELTERLDESAHIQVVRCGDDTVHCAIWL